MTRSAIAGTLVCALSIAAGAFAQAPGTPPKPGPEHKNIGYFAGKWTFEGETKQNPFMPPGKSTGSETCEWFEGGFHLTCRSTSRGPMGESKGMGVWAYDPAEKVYTYYGFDSSGMAFASKGKIDGDTWTWTNDMKMGDKTVKSRYTIKQASPDLYTFKWETSADGTAWTTVQEGKGTRVK